jgi:hypothetical protein
MSGATRVNWLEANQQYLMAKLLLLREVLSQYANDGEERTSGRSDNGNDKLAQVLESAANNLPSPAALDRLCAAFRLSPFERDVLLLCAGVELDSTFGQLCAAAQGDPQCTYPTFSLALSVLPEAHWSAITPAAPLRYWRLVEVTTNDTLTRSPLKIDERVLHYLAGVSGFDVRLQGLIEPLHMHVTLPVSQQEISHQVARVWSQTKEVPNWPIINLCGIDSAANHAVAAFACELCNLPISLIRGVDIPAAITEREALARLWEREGALGGGALLVDCDDLESNRALISFLENVRGMLFVVSREPLRLWRRSIVRFDVHKPNTSEQKTLWQKSLGSIDRLDGQIDLLVSQFNFGAQTIRAVSALTLAEDGNVMPSHKVEAENSADTGEGNLTEPASREQTFDRLWEVCRTQARARLDDLAQRIVPFASWNDIVLPESQLRTLRDIAAHGRHRSKVYETWGFATKSDRGLGMSAMFAGASGTGKTMAAEVLANELNLDLYRIDLSQVVSKYIGETEKNLRRVFDAAEESGAILLFDEADALFGKRSEIKDSHDRYANIEVSYLLQRMESYRGLAILTTNMKGALDSAFLRRISFVVHFPFPDTAQRMEIWRRVFPVQTPTENLDPAKLARLNVAGGNIRNIALHAAFLAADARQPVGMAHLLHAARGEYAKLEKPLTDTETAHWL